MSADPGAVLITGCSTGIGRATATRLAGRGLTVYATARRLASIADLEDAGCRTLALDVTDEGSMRAAVEAVETAHEAVGALVNNAGYSQSGAVETLPMERLRAQFETNVFGLVRMCQLVLGGMRRAGRGRIVNISSMGGKLVFPGGGAYHASKYAVEALSDALRFEVNGFGVRVVVVEPGLITTNPRRLRGPDEAPRRRARRGRADDRASDCVGAPATALQVTASARLALGQRALLSDRAWDAVMRSRFPSPKPE